jgi:HNH endonuclease
MTSNRRAKDEARARQRATGEPYAKARRETARPARARHRAPPRIRPSTRTNSATCAHSSLQNRPSTCRTSGCMQFAQCSKVPAPVNRDGRIDEPDVRLAVSTRMAHLLAGGYHKRARRLPQHVRDQVWRRDGGRCRSCGAAGEEIDHINGDDAALENLQLLCRPCHHAKTASRMVPAADEQRQAISELMQTRVEPQRPVLLCDDEQSWPGQWQNLKKQRRARLLDELAQYGLTRSDFPGRSWSEMWDEVEADEEPDDDWADYDYYDEDGGYYITGPNGEPNPDDDSLYGPNSYFAHAMAKDD